MARKRNGLSKRQRFEVFKRDGFCCQYCGRTPPAVILEADHIIPVVQGGKDHESNMLTACFDCNRGKSDVSLEQVPPALKDQVAEKRDRMAQVRAFNDFLMEVREEENLAIEHLGRHWCNKFKSEKNKFVFGDDRATSVRTFLKHLAEAELYDFIDIAHQKFPVYHSTCSDERTFRYFCGICWKRIKENQ